MKAIRMSAEQVKSDNMREYNPSIWEDRVNDMMKYKDVEFYKVAAGNGYDYDRMFVVYTLPEGLRLMNTFGYSGSISSGGFREVRIKDFDIDKVEITIDGILTSDGSRHSINTTPEARAWMIYKSERFGWVFTKY